MTDTTLEGRLGRATPRENPERTLSVGEPGSVHPGDGLAEAAASELVLTVRPNFWRTVCEAEARDGGVALDSAVAEAETTTA